MFKERWSHRPLNPQNPFEVFILTQITIFVENLPQCARSITDVAPLKYEFACAVRMEGLGLDSRCDLRLRTQDFASK